MEISSFDDITVRPQRTTSKPINETRKLISFWKKEYKNINDEDYDRLPEASLYAATAELIRFCKINNIRIEDYIFWAFSAFEDLFSPRYLLLEKVLASFKAELIKDCEGSGFMIIDTKEVVDFIYKEDGQVLFDIPEDGKAYTSDGKEINVIRV